MINLPSIEPRVVQSPIQFRSPERGVLFGKVPRRQAFPITQTRVRPSVEQSFYNGGVHYVSRQRRYQRRSSCHVARVRIRTSLDQSMNDRIVAVSKRGRYRAE